MRPIAFDPNLDAVNGPALYIEQTAVDDLLGSEREIGIGLIGVGVEVNPTGSIARCDSDSTYFVVCR